MTIEPTERKYPPHWTPEICAQYERGLMERPEGTERQDDEGLIFVPTVIAFKGGKLWSIRGFHDGAWDLVSERIGQMLDWLPARHRLEYIRERCRLGGMIALAFAGDDYFIEAAGLIEPTSDSDGSSTVNAIIYALRKTDLTDLSRICEIIALHHCADKVSLLMIGDGPMIDGYKLEWRSGIRFVQSVSMKPIQ